jgi:hypothetical protein
MNFDLNGLNDVAENIADFGRKYGLLIVIALAGVLVWVIIKIATGGFE